LRFCQGWWRTDTWLFSRRVVRMSSGATASTSISTHSFRSWWSCISSSCRSSTVCWSVLSRWNWSGCRYRCSRLSEKTRLWNDELCAAWTLNFTRAQARFPLSELTARVNTRVDGPSNSVNGPSTRLVETHARQHSPCWRAMETGTVLCCIVYRNCTHNCAQSYEQFLLVNYSLLVWTFLAFFVTKIVIELYLLFII